MSSAQKHFLFIGGYVLLILVELLRWLADMPAESCTALTSIGMAMVGASAASTTRSSPTPKRKGQI